MRIFRDQPKVFLAVEPSLVHNPGQMSTANAVGVALSSAYGVMLGILALNHVRGRPFVNAAIIGAAVLGLYWSFGRQIIT